MGSVSKKNTINQDSTVMTEEHTSNVDEIGMCLRIYSEYSFTQENSSNLHLIIQHSNYMAGF